MIKYFTHKHSSVLMVAIFLFSLATSSSFLNLAIAQTVPSNIPMQNLWSADVPFVMDVAYSEDGQTAYLGGSFLNIVSPPGSGFSIPTIGSDEISVTANVRGGAVKAVVSDGEGGWYIGGSFTSVGGLERAKITHVFENGTVDPDFNVTLNGDVYSLLLDEQNSILYIGGAFTRVNGINKSYLTGINLATNQMTNLSVAPNDGPLAMILSPDGNTLYISGWFTMVAGQSRRAFASINIQNNQLNPLNLLVGNAFSSIQSFVIDNTNNILYIGGSFSTVLGQPRINLAAIDLNSGTLTSFAPQFTGSVSKLELHSGTLYVGGNFTSINNLTRIRLAAFDTQTNQLLPWNPFLRGAAESAPVIDFAVDTQNNKIYVVGLFNQAGSGLGGWTTSKGIAVFDTVSTSTIVWNHQLRDTGIVQGQSVELDLVNDRVFLGVLSPNIEVAVPRNRIAAINMQTGMPTSWNPGADNTVTSLEIDHASDTLYVGGHFTTIGGQNRGALASFNTNIGQLRSWSPTVTSTISFPRVDTMVLDSSVNTLFAGGQFTHVQGQERNNLAAVSTVSDQPTSWNPNVTGTAQGGQSVVRALAIDRPANRAYVGGYISTVGGQARNNFASLDLSTGQPAAWAPSFESCDLYGNCSGSVNAIVIDNQRNKLYVGGVFRSADGSPRNSLAAFNKTTGQIDPWNPNLLFNASDTNLSQVGALSLDTSNSLLYVGGNFLIASGQNRSAIASFNTQDGSLTSWNPDIPRITNATPPIVSNFDIDGERGILHVAGVFYDECTVENDVTCREGYEAYQVQPFGDGGEPCPADFDENGSADVADIFAFLSAWFAGSSNADANGNGSIAVDDIFTFLSSWFAGC